MLRACGRAAGATVHLQRGAAWLRATALASVAEPWRDSFLHANPANRRLLAAA